MLPHGETGDEEVLLLHVGRHAGQAAGAHHLPVRHPGAGDVETLRVSEEEGVKKCWLTGTTGSHDCQNFSGFRQTRDILEDVFHRFSTLSEGFFINLILFTFGLMLRDDLQKNKE